MSQFTDEQIKAALIEYTLREVAYEACLTVDEVKKDANLDQLYRNVDDAIDGPELMKAMRAAIATLGPISVHEPRQVTSGGEQATVCEACADIEAAVLDTYAHNDPYDAAIWPCPTARAHNKETQG